MKVNEQRHPTHLRHCREFMLDGINNEITLKRSMVHAVWFQTELGASVCFVYLQIKSQETHIVDSSLKSLAGNPAMVMVPSIEFTTQCICGNKESFDADTIRSNQYTRATVKPKQVT